MDERDGLRIGEVAELVGVSTRAIRHYHHAGVVPEPPRSGGGYRLYGLANVAQLLRVRRFLQLGLSLAEVRDALADRSEGESDLQEILRDLPRSSVRYSPGRLEGVRPPTVPAHPNLPTSTRRPS